MKENRIRQYCTLHIDHPSAGGGIATVCPASKRGGFCQAAEGGSNAVLDGSHEIRRLMRRGEARGQRGPELADVAGVLR